MTKKELSYDPTILEAVDNLSSMAELDLEELKLEKGDKTDREQLRTSQWLDPKNDIKTIESVKSTLKVVHNYLKHVYSKEGKQLSDKEMQGGVKSIVALASEAVKKIDECAAFFKQKGLLTESKEYIELMEFYEKKILSRFEETLSSEERWEDELKTEEDIADIQRRGLKDLEAVTRDRDYELFHIAKEDGSKFYNRNLIRHIRLVSDFDQMMNDIAEDDPLLRIKTIQDQIVLDLSLNIKKEIQDLLDEWVKKAGKFRDNFFIQELFRAVMALFLSSNKNNTLSHTTGKSCYAYFSDFKNYLRGLLQGNDYREYIENASEEEEPFIRQTLELIHKICFAMFTSQINHTNALSFLLRITASEVPKSKKSTRSSMALWNKLLDDYELLSKELKKHPSGPLFKILDIISDKEPSGFDPYMQDDQPAKLFDIHVNGKKIKVLNLACPTMQRQIDKARIIPEFYGVMRHAKKNYQRFLVINFQDRTSWKEFARSKALEDLQKEAEIKAELEVVTLPKNSDFYLQTNEYMKIGGAQEFKDLILQQLQSEEECGFSFPKSWDRKKLHSFIKDVIDATDRLFFGNKEVYSRKNRLDFIEIVYQFLILYFVIQSGATYLAFTAKDSVDTSATAVGAFFAFIKLLKGDLAWKEEENDFLIALVFLPALLTRERAVDIRALSRMVSMLSVVSGEAECDIHKVQKGLDGLFAPNFTKGLSFDPTESP